MSFTFLFFAWRALLLRFLCCHFTDSFLCLNELKPPPNLKCFNIRYCQAPFDSLPWCSSQMRPLTSGCWREKDNVHYMNKLLIHYWYGAKESVCISSLQSSYRITFNGVFYFQFSTGLHQKTGTCSFILMVAASKGRYLCVNILMVFFRYFILTKMNWYILKRNLFCLSRQEYESN